MGSFNAGGQRYSLMTVEALKASNYDNDQDQTDGRPLPVTSNVTKVYLDDFMHLVKPDKYEKAGDIDDSGKLLRVSCVCGHRLRIRILFFNSQIFTNSKSYGCYRNYAKTNEC